MGNHETSGLHIIIVGAGLAGLACAVSLRRQGHSVEIYERSRFANEVGAAIAMPRNVTRIMSNFGYIPANVKPTVLHRIKMFAHERAEDPSVILPVAPASNEHDFPSYQVHRVDLHSELKRMALDPQGQGGPPCQLRLASVIKCCNPSVPSVTLESGKEVEADLVVIADGIKSDLRKDVLGKPMEPKATGLFCYRFVLPMERLLKDSACDWLTQDLNAVQIPTDTKHRRIVFYPCRNSTLLNVAAIFDERQNKQTHIDPNATVPLQRVLETYHDFHPRYLHILKYATTIRIWPLHHADPYPTWVKGRAVLVGDAAHPMLPHVAQGGAQCIEDAASMGALLPRNTPVKEIHSRLHLFEKVRKPRCSNFQMISYRTAEALPVPPKVETTKKGWINFAYDYDAVQIAKTALSEAGLE